jgi:hypothetical protein
MPHARRVLDGQAEWDPKPADEAVPLHQYGKRSLMDLVSWLPALKFEGANGYG